MSDPSEQARRLFNEIEALATQDKLRLAADLIDNGRSGEALRIIDMARGPLLRDKLFGGH